MRNLPPLGGGGGAGCWPRGGGAWERRAASAPDMLEKPLAARLLRYPPSCLLAGQRARRRGDACYRRRRGEGSQGGASLSVARLVGGRGGASCGEPRTSIQACCWHASPAAMRTRCRAHPLPKRWVATRRRPQGPLPHHPGRSSAQPRCGRARGGQGLRCWVHAAQPRQEGLRSLTPTLRC